jgi:hypothetical protein
MCNIGLGIRGLHVEETNVSSPKFKAMWKAPDASKVTVAFSRAEREHVLNVTSAKLVADSTDNSAQRNRNFIFLLDELRCGPTGWTSHS